VTTLHGRLDLPGLRTIYGRYSQAPLVSISDNQRDPLPGVNWAATVYNGTDLERFTFNEKVGECFVFVGRISPEKNIEGAISIARRTGVPLRIAAKVDPVDVDYYESMIKPLIDGRHVEYLGELGDAEKDELLGSARALLFPVDWPEPFGLAMTEAMACGTPVLALDRGSVSEVVEDGVTGFVRDSEDELADVAERVPGLSRRACRERVERLFSVEVMTDGYENVYRSFLA
jgi:glycosyltransferase involved in cell wall biosynthesis